MSTRIRHRIRRALALTWQERTLFIRAFCWLALVEVRLRLGSDRRSLIAICDSETSHGTEARADDVARAMTYARWIDAAARHHVIRARCLHQSLALRSWLEAEGLPGQLRIGVRLEDGALHAHAWVEVDGNVVNDQTSAVAGFQRLTRYRTDKSDSCAVRLSLPTASRSAGL